jgi:hypothetical protein
LNYEDPGRIDPKLLDEIRSRDEKILSEIKNSNNNDEEVIDESLDSNQMDSSDGPNNQTSSNKFDILEDFNADFENNSNQILRLTHKTSVRAAGVASIDKVLNNIRRIYNEEHKFESNEVKLEENSGEKSEKEGEEVKQNEELKVELPNADTNKLQSNENDESMNVESAPVTEHESAEVNSMETEALTDQQKQVNPVGMNEEP